MNKKTQLHGRDRRLFRKASRLGVEQLEARRLLAGDLELVKDINSLISGTGSSSPQRAVVVGSTAFFVATTPDHGQELWRSDGTESGTTIVKDINSGPANSSPNNLVIVNGELFFSAFDSSGMELWKSNGTESGTIIVKDILPAGGSSNPSSLTNVNGTLYFGANDGTNGTELWKSNGTGLTTSRVKDIFPVAGSSSPSNLTNVGGTLYFSANDGTNGIELWKSDGTELGTTLVQDIRSNPYGSNPANLTNVGGTLYFSANDGTNGIELWKSDGISPGATLVKDIHGTGSSVPSELTELGGKLYFRANDGVTGQTMLTVAEGGNSNTIRYGDFEDLTFDGMLTFAGTSLLNVGSGSLTIGSVVPANLPNLTLLNGGTITAAPISLGSGDAIIGSGTIAARFSGELGSLIQLTGDLSIGKSTSPAGVRTRGDVVVANHTLTLLDSDQAVLGSLTTLGSSTLAGTIVAGNGLIVDFGNNVTGFGTIDTNTTAAVPMIINGAVAGTSVASPITFDGGYIKGVGALDNFVLSGGAISSPGFSPASVYYGSGVYGSDSGALIELGGTSPGSSGHDQINHSGTATLGGTLDVQLINGFAPSVGDSFVIMTSAGGITGEFATEQLPAAPLGSGWSVAYGSNEVRVELVDLANVGSVQLADGGTQHSLVAQMVVKFEGQVDIDSDAFTVLKRGTAGGPVVNSFVPSLDGSGNTLATITFSGGFTRFGGALLDGYYQLTIDGSKVRRAGTKLALDGNGDGLQGGGYTRGTSETDGFFALYGDTNGDGLVDIGEFGQFRAVFGKTPTQTGYNPLFDYDGLGVGISDFGQFRARFGKPKLSFE